MPKSNFKGFDDYVEIFRGGKQVDSSGKEHDGDAMIELAFSTFQADQHQPPLVIGHPKDNEPAYGWIKGLQVKESLGGSKILMAKFEDVVPEFEDLVTAGRYKKRSASFYPDGRLRHVGFLGAVPPAVKGLADLKFQDEEAELLTFDFYDYKTSTIARILGRLRDFLIDSEGVDTADRIIPDWDVDSLKEEATREEPAFIEPKPREDKTMGDENTKNFTEADLEAAKEQARQEAKDAAAAEFAEQESNRKKVEAKTAIKEFLDKGVENGTILPAWIDGGLQEFMENLAEHGMEFSFSEAPPKTALDWFKDFMEEFPKVVNFKELVTRGDLPDNDNAEDIAKRAREFKESEAKAGRVISIAQAVAHVTKG